MANIQVNEAFAAFTADGTTSGYVTVADNSTFYIHAYAYLFSDTQPSQFVRITAKPTNTLIQVQFYTPPDFLARYGQASDCSAYKVAEHARIDMYQQIVDAPDNILVITGGGGSPSGPAGGDLSGTYPNPTVVGFYNRPLNSIPPTIGQVYVWDGTKWTASTPPGGPPSGSAGGDLTGTYPNPTVAKLQGFDIATTTPTSNQVLEWNAGTNKWTPTTLNSSVPIGLKTVIWVDFASTAITPDGSVNFPFISLPQAMTYIASLPANSWQVNVSPGTGSHSTDAFTIPSNRSVIIQAATRTCPTLGTMTMTPTISGNVTAYLRNVNVAGVVMSDSMGSPGTINLFTENVSIGNGGIVQTGLSVADWVHTSGNAFAFENSAPIGSNICSGNVTITGVIKADSMQFIGVSNTDLTASTMILQNCSLASNLHLSGSEVSLTNCKWLVDDATIEFTGSAGLIKLDSYSTKSFRLQTPAVTNGQVVDYIELNQPNFVFTTPPTLPGQLYAYRSDGTIDLAIADTKSHCKALAGLWNNEPDALAVTLGLPYLARFEPGLGIIGGGQTVYVSLTTPGLVTTTEPSITGELIKVVGYLVNGSSYNSAAPTGSTSLIVMQPQPVVSVP